MTKAQQVILVSKPVCVICNDAGKRKMDTEYPDDFEDCFNCALARRAALQAHEGKDR